ncbi:MAG: hypothetical protein R2764_08245 [Bacteroidales bacterium]
MTVNDFINQNNLLPADVIVVGKKNINLLDHYVIYMGEDNGNHWFIANIIDKGVTWLSESDVQEYIIRYAPKGLRRFPHGIERRREAVELAINKVGEGYNLITYNCEHFANEVQFRKAESKQVDDVAKGLLTVTVSALLIGGIASLLKG